MPLIEPSTGNRIVLELSPSKKPDCIWIMFEVDITDAEGRGERIIGQNILKRSDARQLLSDTMRKIESLDVLVAIEDEY